MFGKRRTPAIERPLFYGSLEQATPHLRGQLARDMAEASVFNFSEESEGFGASAGAGAHYSSDVPLASPFQAMLTPGTSQFLVDLSSDDSKDDKLWGPPYNPYVLQQIAKRAVLKEDLATLRVLFGKALSFSKEDYFKRKQEVVYAFRDERQAEIRAELATKLMSKIDDIVRSGNKDIRALTRAGILDAVDTDEFRAEFLRDYKTITTEKAYVFCVDLSQKEEELKQEWQNFDLRIQTACSDVVREINYLFEARGSFEVKVRSFKESLEKIEKSAKEDMERACKRREELGLYMEEIHKQITDTYDQLFSNKRPSDLPFALCQRDGQPLTDSDIINLFFAGLSVDFKGKDDNTLMHLAVATDKPSVFKLLLAYGVNPNTKNRFNVSSADMIFYLEKLHFLCLIPHTGELGTAVVTARAKILEFYKIYEKIKKVLQDYSDIYEAKRYTSGPMSKHRCEAYENLNQAFIALKPPEKLSLKTAAEIYELVHNIREMGALISEFFVTKTVPKEWYEFGKSRLLDQISACFSEELRNDFIALARDLKELEQDCLDKKPGALRTLEDEQKLRTLTLRKSLKGSPTVALSKLAGHYIELQDEHAKLKEERLMLRAEKQRLEQLLLGSRSTLQLLTGASPASSAAGEPTLGLESAAVFFGAEVTPARGGAAAIEHH